MTKPFWSEVNERTLAQGDLLNRCLVPVFTPDFGTNGGDVPVGESDLIIITQSCDLENAKVDLVALCPIYSLMEFEESNPQYKRKGEWEKVRKGRIEGLHLLGSPATPDDNQGALELISGRFLVCRPPIWKSWRRSWGRAGGLIRRS